MNVFERLEVENKKNYDSPSHSCYLVHCQCLSRKKPIKREKNEEEKKNTDTTQTKLNAPRVMYNV